MAVCFFYLSPGEHDVIKQLKQLGLLLGIAVLLVGCSSGAGETTTPPAGSSSNWDVMKWDQDNWS